MTASCTATCCLACGPESEAGPSFRAENRKMPRLRAKRRRGAKAYLAATALSCLAILSTVTMANATRQETEASSGGLVRRMSGIESSVQMGELLRKREAYRPSQILDFEVNVSPPTTCQPMNITFDTRGGVPPWTVFVGFSDWYPYTIELPETYADPDVTTWLYQFDVPVFRPFDTPSSPTPNTVVIVSDSTGNKMNTSAFQTVTERDTSCAPVSGKVDFVFYSDPTITTCSPFRINWENTISSIKDPLNIFLIREQEPPIYIPVSNTSAGMLTYNMTQPPGTNVVLALTDQGGNGGVSGRNVIGGSEYVGTDCLAVASTSIFPHSLPSPTSTLSLARMPDYVASVTSVITSNGVVRTAVAIETFKHGSNFNGSGGLAPGGIAGLAVGIGMAAAILAAIISWCIWRKRNNRRNLLWDIPRSVEGELNKRGGNEPIDQAYLRSRMRPMVRTSSATVPMLPNSAISPTSDNSQHHSGNSPPWDISSNSSIARRYGNIGNALGSREDSSHDLTSSQGAFPMMRRGSGSNSSIASNPFANTHAIHSQPSLRSQRRNHPVDYNRDADPLPPVDPSRFHSSAQQYGDAASLYNTSASSRPPNPTYVLHSDAGLLMDDSLDDEEAVDGQIELPPQYSSVPMRSAHTGSSNGGTMARGASRNTSQGISVRIPQSSSGGSHDRSGPQEEDDLADESEFWRSPTSTLPRAT